jgi:hypothetical protein
MFISFNEFHRGFSTLAAFYISNINKIMHCFVKEPCKRTKYNEIVITTVKTVVAQDTQYEQAFF